MSDSEIGRVYAEGLDTVVGLVRGMSAENDLLGSTIVGLNSEIVALKELAVKQATLIAEYEARFKKNSATSSKPPS